jgi:hypothetical protein
MGKEVYPLTVDQWDDMKGSLHKILGIGEMLTNTKPEEFPNGDGMFSDLGNILNGAAMKTIGILEDTEKAGWADKAEEKASGGNGNGTGAEKSPFPVQG